MHFGGCEGKCLHVGQVSSLVLLRPFVCHFDKLIIGRVWRTGSLTDEGEEAERLIDGGNDLG